MYDWTDTARWIATNFPVAAAPLRDLGLRDASDEEIFAAARGADAIVLTKDSDFVRLLEEQGSPPKVFWLTCGNTSEAAFFGIGSDYDVRSRSAPIPCAPPPSGFIQRFAPVNRPGRLSFKACFDSLPRYCSRPVTGLSV